MFQDLTVVGCEDDRKYWRVVDWDDMKTAERACGNDLVIGEDSDVENQGEGRGVTVGYVRSGLSQLPVMSAKRTASAGQNVYS